MLIYFRKPVEFEDAEKARKWLEARRWPDAPVCPHCGQTGVTRLTPKPNAKGHGRKGLYQCNGCRSQFTVTVGTVFQDSHVPLNLWLLAVHLWCAGKRPVSAQALHRQLGVSYKTAWSMAARIRYGIARERLPARPRHARSSPRTFDETLAALLSVAPPAKQARQPKDDGMEDLVAAIREKRRQMRSK